MAYVKFKKDDEASIKKNYIPNSVKVEEHYTKLHEETQEKHEKTIKTYKEYIKLQKNKQKVQLNNPSRINIWKIVSIIETLTIIYLLIK